MAVGAITTQAVPVTNMLMGRQALIAGAATVVLPQITEESIIVMSGNSAAATGALRAVITAGTGFVITSLVGAGDTGLVGWLVIIPPAD